MTFPSSKYRCKSPMHRVRETCQKREISLAKYICDGFYHNEVNFKYAVRNSGAVDSVTGLACKFRSF